MTRRARSCRCCEGPSSGPYCEPCRLHAARHAATVADTIRHLWGEHGLAMYETALRAKRLAAKRNYRRTA